MRPALAVASYTAAQEADAGTRAGQSGPRWKL